MRSQRRKIFRECANYEIIKKLVNWRGSEELFLAEKGEDEEGREEGKSQRKAISKGRVK